MDQECILCGYHKYIIFEIFVRMNFRLGVHNLHFIHETKNLCPGRMCISTLTVIITCIRHLYASHELYQSNVPCSMHSIAARINVLPYYLKYKLNLCRIPHESTSERFTLVLLQ